VRFPVRPLFAKLGVNSRAQAIVRAREAGFGRKKG
jgi:DNA-binding CsgD family transcriptional regulator